MNFYSGEDSRISQAILVPLVAALQGSICVMNYVSTKLETPSRGVVPAHTQLMLFPFTDLVKMSFPPIIKCVSLGMHTHMRA